MITDLEADKLADEYPNASPERKPQIETALRTWVTAAEAEAADRAREGAARLRQSFKSVSDLGGLWTKEQELRLPPTDNPDEVKARVANTAFLAEAGGMDYETAAKTYEGLRARWAQATLGKKDAGDLEMYAEVSRQYQDGEDKAKLAFQRDADAASRGFQRALEGAPPEWSTPESEWRKGAEKAPGFDANWGFGLEQSVAYRDAFQRAFKVATEHRPLVLETLDTLKRGTKWINQGAGLSEEAASRLMELPDAERADVLRAIVAGAASMSPEDPGAAVSNLQKVFKNMGISASRGLDALRLSKVSQALSAADAASALEAIKDGRTVYDLGGGRIVTSPTVVQGGFGGEVALQSAEPVPASEIPALTKKLEGTLKFYQITNQLEQVSRQYLDPIRPAYKTGPGWVAETMAVGLAGSAPQMVAGAIPGVGLPWMTASFVDSAYERIVADQPDIDPRSALAMATVAGTIEGGIEMLQIRNAVGLLPATSKLVQAIRTPNVKLFKALGIQLGANIAEQNLEEALQDLALPTVKAIGAALDKDIEGVNWAQEWQEFGGTRLETFLSVLPLAILGAGAAGIRETTAFRNLLASEQALVEYGLPREVAAAIASQETPEARQAVFFEEQSKRTPESIRAGIAEAEARVARETVAATSNETPTMVYEGGKFRIVEPDGSSSMAFDDAETASLALQSRNEWEASGAAVAVRELADWLGMRDSDKRKWEVVPKIVTLEDDTLATPEQIAERMQLAGLEGLAPSEAQVFGQNVTEVRDGMVRVVNSVFVGSNPLDVVEEEGHFRFRQEMDAGTITREQAEAAVRAFQGDRAPQTFSDQALDEGVAEMVRAYFAGNTRFIRNLPQSVRAFFVRMAVFFRDAFRNAAKLKKLIRDGKIDANWVAFLNRSVGLTEAVQEQEAAMKAAQEIVGQPSVITTAPDFSLGTTPAEVIEPPAVAELQGLQTVEVPVDQLKLSADVPQFKRGAIGGIVKPLEGKFDKTGVGPIQVWRRLNGDLEVISGRHRWDLAKRSGIATIPAQVHEESKGFTAKQAATLDAELNIRDEQGSVADFAVFFRNSELTEEEAKAKGYLQRVKGQQGWTIGKNASEDVFAAHQAARINDAAAAAVAASAPNDSSLQAVGLKAVLEGKNADFAGNLVKAYAGRVEQKKSEGADFGDLFSFDDSAIKEAEQEAALVSKIQKDIREDIRSVRDAARFPQRAKKFGVNVNKPETVLAAVTQLESELMKWEGSWFMDPELKSKLKQMKETGQIIREPQVRFSIGARQVSETDRKYLDAVNSGDMETAQRMVTDAAEKSGYIRMLFHQTNKKNVAKIYSEGFRTDLPQARLSDPQMPDGIFLKPDQSNIKVGGYTEDEISQIRVFVKLENPLYFENRYDLVKFISSKNPNFSETQAEFTRSDKETVAEADRLEKIAESFPQGPEQESAWDRYFNETDILFAEGRKSLEEIASRARAIATAVVRSSADGIVVENDMGSFGRKTKTYVVLDPNQIKSADPVTRDDAGNIIPLSQRFNPETPDIRFSVGRKAAPYAEQLAAQMDALKTKPTVRIQIYERARKKFTDLVARHRAAIAEAQAADTRKPSEIIEEAKATHDAEVARIDAERDAALAEATTDKQRNTARLVHGTKLRAANMALSKALAAATGEGTRQARTAQVVGELNAILSAFPAEVRGRVGGFVQLASLKTETGRANELSRRLAKAETELEKLLRKEYRAQLDRVLDSYRPQREAGKKPKGKIGAQAQEILDAAEAAMIMDATDVAALVAKYDALANDPDASPEDVIKNGTIRDILPLLGDIKNADSARLVSAIDAVKLVGSEGWARWKFQQLQLKEDREISRKGLVQDTGKTGVRAERVEAEKNAVSVAGKSLTALLNLSSFSQVVDYLFGAESKFGSEFKKREMEASNQLEDKMDALNTAISDLFTEMAGGVVDGERLHYKLSQRSIKTDQGDFSELEALTAVLMWMQEDGKRHMIGKLDENGQPAGAWHYNQDFVDALTKSLSPEAVKVMDWLRKQYDAEHAELNPLYQKRHGVSLPKHENYSPISANPQQTKLGQTVDPVSGAPVSGSILTPGSLRSRSLTAVAEPNFRDALKVFLAHKRSMEHWAAYYDLAVDAQAILAHRDVTNAVDAKAGPEGKTVLTGWLNYFAQGGIREAAASLSISRQLSRMLGRASMMALFGRASTVMVQSTQLAAASVKMPLGAYVLRLSKLISGQLGWGDAIKSEFIQRRLKQAPAIVQQAMQALGDAGKPNLIKHAARQVGKLITGADALFTAGTYAILLDFHKGNAAELNLTGQEADRFAHDQAAQDTEAVAQPTRAANRSLAELTATHPMARLGWSFASEARQKIALTAWAVQGGDAAQVSKTMVLTFIVGGLFTQILKNLWREMKGDDDEEKWSAKRLAIASVTGPLNGIPGFNALTGDGGTLFSKLKQTGRAVESLLDGEQSAAQVVQGMNTLLSAMGLFSDNAAALSVMGNVATDAAKLLQNVSGEKTSSK